MSPDRLGRLSDGLRGAAGMAPDLTRSFDQVIAQGGYAPLADHAFGTAGGTRIGDATALDGLFRSYANNLTPSSLVINSEVQRYAPFSAAGNFVFAPDALELTATVDGAAPAVATRTLTAAAANSRQIAVSDASGIAPGQVVGFGQAQQVWATRSNALRGAIAPGNTVSITLTHALGAAAGGFDPVVLTQIADGASTFASLAQGFVDQINANATLAAFGIVAFKQPVNPGGYAINVPRHGPSDAPFGPTAEGSLTWVSIALATAGALVHEYKSTVLTTHVVAIAGNMLTLSHPVTQPAGATLYVSPTRMLMRSTTYSGSGATIPVGDTTGLSTGQMVSLGPQDSNLRRITALTATDVTLEATVSATDGSYLFAYQAWGATSSAATSASAVLSFAAVPAGVQVGMQAVDQAGLNSGNWRVVAINRASSPQTVTLDTAVTKGSGLRWVFHPAIASAQIWSKAIYMPEPGRTWLAMELVADFPDIRAGAAWPAFWLFRDPTDPAPGAVPTGSNGSEIDMIEQYNYHNNNSAGGHRPGIGGTALYSNAAYAPASPLTAGNNMGLRERKVQMIMSADKVYLYLDGVLMLARNFVYNSSARFQLGINLAVGSIATSFNSNGFFPTDWSQFPMRLRVKRLRVLSAN